RNFQDSSSFRLGGEYDTNAIFKHNRTTFRAGVSYETSAIPQNWVSPLTYDANKIIGSLGGSIHVGEHWRMDAVFALVLYDGTDVDPATASVPRINPVKGNPVATESVNGGTYSARATLLGVGVQYKF
ncbi:MAG TPA: outer membrane protein transport protein, partial [Labilithrix sp.]